MKVVVKKAGYNPEVREIPNELKAFHDIVGGHIECVRLGIGNIIMVCNEEGKLIGLPPNFMFSRDIIVGDVFFCTAGYEDFESLTNDQIEFLMVFFNFFEKQKEK